MGPRVNAIERIDEMPANQGPWSGLATLLGNYCAPWTGKSGPYDPSGVTIHPGTLNHLPWFCCCGKA